MKGRGATITMRIFLVITTVFVLVSVNVIALEISPITANDTPKRIFTSTFRSTVHSSEQLLEVFSVSSSPEDLSHAFFNVTFQAVSEANIPGSESIARTISDAVLHTLVYMSVDDFLFSISDTTATYIVSQDLLNFDNAALLSSSFAYDIAKNIKHEDNVDKAVTLAKALNYGIFDFLSKLEVYKTIRIAAYSIYASRRGYTASGIRGEDTETIFHKIPVSKWDSYLASIPPSSTIFGLTTFTSTFLKAVSNSPVLLKAFDLKRFSASDVSAAWYKSIYDSATQAGSSYSEALAEYLAQRLLRVFNFMESSDYAKAIGNSLGLYFISQGLLNIENAELLSNELSDSMRNRAEKVTNDRDVLSYVNVVGKGLKDFSKNHKTLIYNSEKLAAIVYYLSNEIYYLTGTKEQALY